MMAHSSDKEYWCLPVRKAQAAQQQQAMPFNNATTADGILKQDPQILSDDVQHVLCLGQATRQNTTDAEGNPDAGRQANAAIYCWQPLGALGKTNPHANGTAVCVQPFGQARRARKPTDSQSNITTAAYTTHPQLSQLQANLTYQHSQTASPSRMPRTMILNSPPGTLGTYHVHICR
jgi:hypothetical protein